MNHLDIKLEHLVVIIIIAFVAGVYLCEFFVTPIKEPIADCSVVDLTDKNGHSEEKTGGDDLISEGENYKMVFLVNQELKMKRGKQCAQVKNN